VSLVLLAALAHAGDNPQPTVKMGGVIYAHWGMDLSEGADGANAFDLSRVYLTARGDLNDHLATRVTLDADRIKPVETDAGDLSIDTKTRVFVKHAYLEWKDVGPGVKARFGMVDTAYLPYYDQFWGWRFVSKSAGDEAKWLDTADLGFQFMGTHAKGLVDWQAGVLNGEGYGKLEVDASKTAQARISVDPLAPGGSMNLPISGFVSQSFLGEADAITVYGGGVGFKQDYVKVWGEFLGRSEGGTSGTLISATVMPRIPDVLTIGARFDRLDPDSSTDGDSSTKIIAGVGHDFYERVSAVVDYERVTPEGGDPTHGVYLKMQAGF